MNVSALAAEIVALRLHGHTTDVIERYFADDVTCLEVSEPMRVHIGKHAALAAWTRWLSTREVHGCAALGPWVNNNRIVSVMLFDVTCGLTTQRCIERETAIYVVRDERVQQLQHFTTTLTDPAAVSRVSAGLAMV